MIIHSAMADQMTDIQTRLLPALAERMSEDDDESDDEDGKKKKSKKSKKQTTMAKKDMGGKGHRRDMRSNEDEFMDNEDEDEEEEEKENEMLYDPALLYVPLFISILHIYHSFQFFNFSNTFLIKKSPSINIKLIYHV